MIKKSILSLCLGIMLYPNLCKGQDNIFSFYGKAYTRTQSPPDESKLIMICEQKVKDFFVTFIGFESKKVLLAAVTKVKLANPKEDIWLKWRFVPSGQNPKGGVTADWGYVFDRNGDGKIDYIAFLMGPLWVKDKDFPIDYPKMGEKLNGEQVRLMINSTKLVFRYFADENFDGKVDAVVLEVLDDRTWVDHWLFARNSHFDGVIDDGWHFKSNISEKLSDLIKTDQGYLWGGFGGSILGNQLLATGSEIMSNFNEGAKACGFTKDSFYNE